MVSRPSAVLVLYSPYHEVYLKINFTSMGGGSGDDPDLAVVVFHTIFYT